MVSARNAGVYAFLVELLAIVGILISTMANSIIGIIGISFFTIFVFYTSLVLTKVDVISNLKYLVPGLGAIYGFTYPFLKYGLHILPTELRAADKRTMLIGTMYISLVLIVYMILCSLTPKIYKSRRREFSIESYGKFNLKVNNIVIDLLFAAFYLVMFRLYRNMGGYTAVFSGDVSRRVLSDQYNTISTFFAYVKYMYAGYSVYVLYTFLNKSSRLTDGIINIIRLLLVVTFWGLDVALGNRRLITYILLAIMLYYTNKSDFKLRIKYVVPVAAVVLFLIYIGVARNVANTNTEISVRDAFGEFIYPMVTLYYYIGNTSQWLYGSSLFCVFFSFIPRSIWPGKPESLAKHFMSDYHTVMGYGYTPFTEIYVNFGYFGILIGAVLLFAYFNFITKNKSKYPILYLASYMQLLNFFRGEFTSSLVEIIIIGITIKILSLIN